MCHLLSAENTHTGLTAIGELTESLNSIKSLELEGAVHICEDEGADSADVVLKTRDKTDESKLSTTLIYFIYAFTLETHCICEVCEEVSSSELCQI